jgi:pimeloyl-ACP methyl ester carboxylesterase
MQSTFSDCKTLELDGVGHFPQEEAPKDVIEAISDFLN